MVPNLMRKSWSGRPPFRRGFTLIEMLVVIAIIGVLAAMVVFAFPSFSSRKRASNGAVQLQGYLYQAKQRALRDGMPRGLRLFYDPTATNWHVTEAQFTEVPDDFTGGRLETRAADPDIRVVYLTGVDIQQGYGADQSGWLIQPGDVLEIQGVGLPHRILSIGVEPGPYTYKITLESPLPTANSLPSGTTHYRTMGSPRVVGESFKLPDDVVIDLKTNLQNLPQFPGNHLPGLGTSPHIDILFSPSGKVVTPGVSTDFLALWVRDSTLSSPFEGNPSITAVHVRSGLVATHPPATSGNAYQYVIDGRTPE